MEKAWHHQRLAAHDTEDGGNPDRLAQGRAVKVPLRPEWIRIQGDDDMSDDIEHFAEKRADAAPVAFLDDEMDELADMLAAALHETLRILQTNDSLDRFH